MLLQVLADGAREVGVYERRDHGNLVAALGHAAARQLEWAPVR